MSETHVRGSDAVDQANDNSIMNTEPAVVRSAIVGIVSAICAILVIGGWIDEDQKQVLIDNVGIIVPAALAIVGLLSGIWTRAGVYSPKTAAEIAVDNSASPVGAEPSLPKAA